MTQASKCMFCGEPPRITLIRTEDGKAVPVCRQCVPRRMRLSWAENLTADALGAAKVPVDMQKSRVNQ